MNRRLLIAMLDVTEVLYPVHDALGSVIGLARGSDGQLVEKISYDPYGQTHFERQVEDPPGSGTFVWSRTDPNGEPWGKSAYGNPFGWTGQRYDHGVDLYSFPFRSYSPTLGRWIQRDPLRYIDGVNMYEYVRSGPLRYIDPLGLRSFYPYPIPITGPIDIPPEAIPPNPLPPPSKPPCPDEKDDLVDPVKDDDDILDVEAPIGCGDGPGSGDGAADSPGNDSDDGTDDDPDWKYAAIGGGVLGYIGNAIQRGITTTKAGARFGPKAAILLGAAGTVIPGVAEGVEDAAGLTTEAIKQAISAIDQAISAIDEALRDAPSPYDPDEPFYMVPGYQ